MRPVQPSELIGRASSRLRPYKVRGRDGVRRWEPVREPRQRWTEFEIHRVGDGWLVKAIGKSVVDGETDRITEAAALTVDEVAEALRSPQGHYSATAVEALAEAVKADRRLWPTLEKVADEYVPSNIK